MVNDCIGVIDWTYTFRIGSTDKGVPYRFEGLTMHSFVLPYCLDRKDRLIIGESLQKRPLSNTNFPHSPLGITIIVYFKYLLHLYCICVIGYCLKTVFRCQCWLANSHFMPDKSCRCHPRVA